MAARTMVRDLLVFYRGFLFWFFTPGPGRAPRSAHNMAHISRTRTCTARLINSTVARIRQDNEAVYGVFCVLSVSLFKLNNIINDLWFNAAELLQLVIYSTALQTLENN